MVCTGREGVFGILYVLLLSPGGLRVRGLRRTMSIQVKDTLASTCTWAALGRMIGSFVECSVCGDGCALVHCPAAWAGGRLVVWLSRHVVSSAGGQTQTGVGGVWRGLREGCLQHLEVERIPGGTSPGGCLPCTRALEVRHPEGAHASPCVDYLEQVVDSAVAPGTGCTLLAVTRGWFAAPPGCYMLSLSL